MKYLILPTILWMLNCITTVSPGFLYNSTTEHIYPMGNRNHLGTARIERRAETCVYNSMFLKPLYHSHLASIESVMAENKISKIGVIDYRSFSVLGAFLYSNCIIIWGEP
jgi:hypothetical protein